MVPTADVEIDAHRPLVRRRQSSGQRVGFLGGGSKIEVLGKDVTLRHIWTSFPVNVLLTLRTCA